MRIFLTGSEGFIGSALKSKLISEGFSVEGYDIRADARDNVNDYERLQKRIGEFAPDGIVHLAAVSRVEDGFKNPKLCVDTNLGATANILEVIRRTKNGGGKTPWLIFGSSREVFGEPKELPVTEESPKVPLNVYGVAKLASEMLVENYANNYGLKAWVLRFSNVYTGPNDRPERVIPSFIRAALKNEPLNIHGGKQVFSFTHIEDTALGIAKAVNFIKDSPAPYNHFNLLSREKISIINLVELVIKLSASKSKTVFTGPRTYDVNTFWGDPQKALEELDWEAKITIDEGLKRAIEYFKGVL